MSKSDAGKGSSPRPIDNMEFFLSEYERIFPPKEETPEETE